MAIALTFVNASGASAQLVAGASNTAAADAIVNASDSASGGDVGANALTLAGVFVVKQSPSATIYKRLVRIVADNQLSQFDLSTDQKRNDLNLKRGVQDMQDLLAFATGA